MTPQGCKFEAHVGCRDYLKIKSGKKKKKGGTQTHPQPIKIGQHPQHIIVKLANLKEKILKAAHDKRSVTYKDRNVRLAADLSGEIHQARRNGMIYSGC